MDQSRTPAFRHCFGKRAVQSQAFKQQNVLNNLHRMTLMLFFLLVITWGKIIALKVSWLNNKEIAFLSVLAIIVQITLSPLLFKGKQTRITEVINSLTTSLCPVS